jgi:hypothetical protein
MAISLNTSSIPVNTSNGDVDVKVAQLAKEQQKAEGKIAVDLINAATPQPVGNSGHNINTTA